jgi:hypothetical protein
MVNKGEVKNVFVNVWRKNIFNIYVTEYGTALTTILPILFLYLNTVTVLRTILQRESQNSQLYKQTKSVNNRKTVKTVMTLTWYRRTCIMCMCN